MSDRKDVWVRLPDLDCDDPDILDAVHRWGGATLATVKIKRGGRFVTAHLNARISGDQRGGATYGVHLSLSVVGREHEASKGVHADTRRGWGAEDDR